MQDFDGEEFLECIKDLLRIDKDWVPGAENCSLYIRPTMIGTEVSVLNSQRKDKILYQFCFVNLHDCTSSVMISEQIQYDYAVGLWDIFGI